MVMEEERNTAVQKNWRNCKWEDLGVKNLMHELMNCKKG